MTCFLFQGDSGGPLMGDHPDSNQTYLAGVVSWGLGCARKKSLKNK